MFSLVSLQLFPCNIPDLSCGKPLVVSGRYNGNFPDSIKISGILADMSTFTLDLEARKAKDVPLDRVMLHIDLLALSSCKTLPEDNSAIVLFSPCICVLRHDCLFRLAHKTNFFSPV